MLCNYIQLFFFDLSLLCPTFSFLFRVLPKKPSNPKYYVWDLKCDVLICHHFVLLFFYVAFALWTVWSQPQVNGNEYGSLVE